MRARDVEGTKSARIIEQQGKKLPKTLFVKYELSDDPYLECSDNISDLADKDDDSVYVGEYHLVKTAKVSLVLQVK